MTLNATKIKQAKELIAQEAQELISFLAQKEDLPKFGKRLQQGLKRAKDEFEARLFFIIVVGPVKSGKSTLVNLLAKKNVSPMHYAECTARPSLIIQAEQEGIDQYFVKSHVKDKNEAFQTVIDYLRGIKSIEELEAVAIKKAFALTQENINEKITEDIGLANEPLITVIRVQGGELLNNQIALIDMPGLDGMKSNRDNNVVFDWISKRSDFLLFIQSSMAAFNKDSETFLSDIYEGSKKPPIHLLQNIMDAKYWQSEEKRLNERKSQLETGIKQLQKILGIKDIKSRPINLGMACDVLLKEEEYPTDTLVYLEKAAKDFQTFEHDLIDTLKHEREHYQFENALHGLQDFINAQLQYIENEILAIKNEVSTWHDQKTKTGKALDSLMNIDYGRAKIDFKTRLVEYSDNALKEWYKEIEAEQAYLGSANNHKINGDQLRKIVDQFAAEVALKMERAFGIDTTFQKEIINTIEERIKVLEEKSETNWERAFEEASLCFQMPDLKWTITDFPDLDTKPFYADKEKVKTKKWLFLDQSYQGSDVKEILKEYSIVFRNEAKERTHSYQIQMDTAFKHYCEKRICLRREDAEQQIESFEKKYTNRFNELGQLQELSEQIKDKLLQLQQSVEIQ